MQVTKTLYVIHRKDWRQWLKQHSKTEKEIWLVYYRKESGQPRLAYNDAVEEALCFGWIDSIVKNLDQARFAQRFSPRKPKSGYSQTNQERLRKLIQQRKVSKDVLATLDMRALGKVKIPPDIRQALKANKQAWKNFGKYGEAYKRIRIAYIDGARHRPAEFKKRLNYFLKMTEKDKQFGFGIQQYY